MPSGTINIPAAIGTGIILILFIFGFKYILAIAILLLFIAGYILFNMLF